MKSTESTEFERQCAIQSILERAIEAHLDAAIDSAFERFSDGYALDYIAGLLLRKQQAWGISHPNPNPQKKKHKITATLRREVFERDAYRCRKCNSYISLTVDHIVAESNGGATEKSNLQTLCRPCNSRKGIS